MKRAIVIIVGLAVLLLGVAPVGFGYLAERRMNSLLEQLSKSGDLDFTVIKVERGWFNTTTDVVAEVTGDIGDAYRGYLTKAKAKDIRPLSVTFRNHIHHGPISFGALGDGAAALMPALATVDSEVISYGGGKAVEGHVPVDIRTRLNLLGGGTTNIVIPEWKGPVDGDKGTLTWKGLKGKISFSKDLKKVRSTLKAPYMEGVDNKLGMLFSGMELHTDTHAGIEGLSLGDVSFKLAKLEVEPKATASTKVTLEGASVTGTSKASGDMVNTSAELRVQGIRVGDMHFGPATYALSLRNLDAKSMAKINAEIKKLKQQNLPPQQMSMMLGATMLGVLPQLLEKGPVLEITDLSLVTDYGKVHGKGRLTVDTTNRAVLSNPMLLKNAVVANVEFEIPEKLVTALTIKGLKKELNPLDIKYTDEQIEAMAKARIKKQMSKSPAAQMLVLDNGMYRFSASIAGGQLTINGKPFAPPARQAH